MSKPEDTVQGIDHLIVMVADLDRAERLWRGLGFATTARGFHGSGGTANHLIMLDRTYIELLGMAEPAAESPYRHMMQAPGLWGAALRGSAQSTFQLWSSAGLPVEPPADLSRGVEISGRSELARFRLTMLQRSPELPFLLFCCEHVTPEFVWHADIPRHANGARRLRELIVLSEDDSTVQSFERVAGRSASRQAAGSYDLALGALPVTFLSGAQFEHRFDLSARFGTRRAPLLAGFALTSDDLNRARAFAESSGCRVQTTEAGGFVARLPEEGLVIEWSPEA